jgi:hypothetical protein
MALTNGAAAAGKNHHMRATGTELAIGTTTGMATIGSKAAGNMDMDMTMGTTGISIYL